MPEILRKELSNTNFITFTGYKTLLIFQILLEEPKTLEEIKEKLYQNDLINDTISDDTIRNYIKSLRTLGCKISKASKSNEHKFIMCRHPLELNLTKSQLNVLKKISKIIKENEDVKELENFENFVLKLISVIKCQDTINFLNGLLTVNKINRDIYNALIKCCKNKLTAKFLYKSGLINQELSFYCDKIFLKSEKLYLAGYNMRYKNYSSLLINRINSIIDVTSEDKPYELTENDIICEIYNPNYETEENEIILNTYSDKVVIKMLCKDEFRTVQKILSMGCECKILKPENFKNKIKNKLLEMRSLYE